MKRYPNKESGTGRHGASASPNSSGKAQPVGSQQPINLHCKAHIGGRRVVLVENILLKHSKKDMAAVWFEGRGGIKRKGEIIRTWWTRRNEEGGGGDREEKRSLGSIEDMRERCTINVAN